MHSQKTKDQSQDVEDGQITVNNTSNLANSILQTSLKGSKDCSSVGTPVEGSAGEE